MQRLTLFSLTLLSVLLVAPTRTHAQAGATSVVRLEATPPSVVVMTGEEVPFEVRALDAQGRVVADAQVRTVAPRAAATVRGGTVRGRTMGEYEIVATLLTPPGYEGTPLSLRVPLTVLAPEVATVEVTPEPGRLYQGTTLRHTATARHADGSVRPGPAVSWSSSDPSVATVDRFGYVTATGTGAVTIRAEVEGTAGTAAYDVAPFPAASLDITGLADEVRTGDVQHLTAVARDAAGEVVADVPVTWTHTAVPDAEMIAPSAPGQIARGRFVADVPGVYTIVANAGPLSARATLQAVGRDAVRELTLVGTGSTATVRTTDFWVFEGLDGRDYALTGAKMSDGYAYAWDVTNPGNIFKTDSLQVDARAVNDVKVSPNARYATLTREGASNRRNGVVFLDLADPAHPVIASEVVEGLTGGVHNAFPTTTTPTCSPPATSTSSSTSPTSTTRAWSANTTIPTAACTTSGCWTESPTRPSGRRAWWPLTWATGAGEALRRTPCSSPSWRCRPAPPTPSSRTGRNPRTASTSSSGTRTCSAEASPTLDRAAAERTSCRTTRRRG